jgi:hypothetical protein
VHLLVISVFESSSSYTVPVSAVTDHENQSITTIVVVVVRDDDDDDNNNDNNI